MSAAALPIALTVAGAGLMAGGSIIGGNSQAASLRAQADQLDVEAGADIASSQRKAMEERRQARLAGSRALALAASSGAGVDDPSVVNAIAGIEGEGEYRALVALYEGETSAQSKKAQAEANRRGAKSAKLAGILGAGGSVLSAGGSLAGRYG
jgi:hypothetical protein